MKTIGMIGGMSWESTITYYEEINRIINEKLGGFHSAKILMHSVDFAEIEKLQSEGDWDAEAESITRAAQGLEKAGADFIIICTNTVHKVAPQIQSEISIPILHIAEATADVLKEEGIRCAGLLGTKYTMTEDFYKEKIQEAGIDVLIPDEEDIEYINGVIFDELCLGRISDDSRKEFIRIIGNLEKRGAEGVILGCTEIGMLVTQSHSPLKVYDTTLIHAKAAAEEAVADTPVNYTYILRCSDESLYTGWTNNLSKRVATHNAGKGGKYTKTRTPVELVYYETFDTKEKAMSREWHIKRLKKSEKEKLVSGFKVEA